MAVIRAWQRLAQCDWMNNDSSLPKRILALLIFCAALLLIGGLIVPHLINADNTAGEHAAIASLINISNAERAYREQYPNIGFAPLAALSVTRDKHCEPSPEHACLLEYGLASNNGHPFRGYYYVDTTSPQTPRTEYLVVAIPAYPGKTGVRSFCITEQGMPRMKDLGRNLRPQNITRDQCLRNFTPLP
jgi:hypothetical protein